LVAPEKALPHDRRLVPSRGLDNCTANNAGRVLFKPYSNETAEISGGNRSMDLRYPRDHVREIIIEHPRSKA
jgi:hypothetical protein